MFYKNLKRKINKSGYFELIYLIFTYIFSLVITKINISVLNLRGFDVDYSASIGRGVTFFQSARKSIKIGKNVVIGSGVLLKAGFDGKIIISDDVAIHEYSMIYSHRTLKIGRGTMIAPSCFITDFDHKHTKGGYKGSLLNKKGYIDETTEIGRNVWIGTHSVVLKGVSIGDDSIVGAGSIVTKSVPRSVVVAGNPAKKIKKLI